MMYNNALMRFWPMNNGGPNMGPPTGMLNPMPFEGNYNPHGPYKQPFSPMPFEGNMPGWQKGMPPWGQNSLVSAQNALLGIGGRGSGMNTMNEPMMGNYRRPGMMGTKQRY